MTLWLAGEGVYKREMPWKASSVVEERTRFVIEYERGLHTMAELCRIYGVSRQTGHTWWNRYGEAGL